MDRLRKKFLARAAFAPQKHGRIRPCNYGYGFEHLLECGTFPDDPLHFDRRMRDGVGPVLIGRILQCPLRIDAPLTIRSQGAMEANSSADEVGDHRQEHYVLIVEGAGGAVPCAVERQHSKDLMLSLHRDANKGNWEGIAAVICFRVSLK